MSEKGGPRAASSLSQAAKKGAEDEDMPDSTYDPFFKSPNLALKRGQAQAAESPMQQLQRQALEDAAQEGGPGAKL